MKLTREERQRMFERQRTISLPAVPRRRDEARAVALARPSRAVLVALTLAALAAAVATLGPHLAMTMPQSLLDALMPAVF